MKFKVTGIVASPRKGMNTDTLVQRILAGCQDAGAAVEMIYLNDLEIKPCQACRVQDGAGCVFEDGMEKVYEALESSDGLVIGTPVYYNSVSGQMKLAMDRCYCLARAVDLPSGQRIYETAVKKRKKGLVAAVGGSGLNPQCVLPVFEIWSPEVNLEIIDRVLVTRAQLGLDPMASHDLLEEIYAKGRNLVGQLKAS